MRKIEILMVLNIMICVRLKSKVKIESRVSDDKYECSCPFDACSSREYTRRKFARQEKNEKGERKRMSKNNTHKIDAYIEGQYESMCHTCNKRKNT